jgi:hypothetical protein
VPIHRNVGGQTYGARWNRTVSRTIHSICSYVGFRKDFPFNTVLLPALPTRRLSGLLNPFACDDFYYAGLLGKNRISTALRRLLPWLLRSLEYTIRKCSQSGFWKQNQLSVCPPSTNKCCTNICAWNSLLRLCRWTSLRHQHLELLTTKDWNIRQFFFVLHVYSISTIQCSCNVILKYMIHMLLHTIDKSTFCFRSIIRNILVTLNVRTIAVWNSYVV